MRISSCYGLVQTQGSLDFVDVDTENDIPLFIDPDATKSVPGEWGLECKALIDSFFGALMSALAAGDKEKGLYLLGNLREPNETHLGLSAGRSRGRTLGPGSSLKIWDALSQSKIAESGLIDAIEEAALVVEGVGVDIVSDIVCNIIRGPLIDYTQIASEFYGIALEEGVDSGPLWDPDAETWRSEFVRLPVAGGGKLLLVPKIIVRRHFHIDIDEYYRNYVIEDIRRDELGRGGGGIVGRRRDGTLFVTKKAIEAKYGSGKPLVIQRTLSKPGLLEKYRREARSKPNLPLSHEDVAALTSVPQPDWRTLLNNVVSISPGRATADDYEKACIQLLSALLYPELSMPKAQDRIHEGRKRLDISFLATRVDNFIGVLVSRHGLSLLPIECKNYNAELDNPAADQLTGRFSHDRGRVGLLLCRSVNDRTLWDQRCRDTLRDDRGLILTITDEELAEMVRLREAGQDKWLPLQAQYRRLLAN